MRRALLAAACLAGALGCGGALGADEMRFELSVLPEFQRYAALFSHPGYAAIALEYNDLSPSLSSKLVVSERGRAVEMRYARLRFTGQKNGVHGYEATLLSGLGTAGPRLSFPVTVDASALPSGKLSIALKPPLGSMLPAEFHDRIQVKMRMVANAAAQKKALGYLEQLTKAGAGDDAALFEAILVDSYNRSGGPAGPSTPDVGDALPLSDQWMLILTVLIWIVAVPAAYLVHWRRRRPQPD